MVVFILSSPIKMFQLFSDFKGCLVLSCFVIIIACEIRILIIGLWQMLIQIFSNFSLAQDNSCRILNFKQGTYTIILLASIAIKLSLTIYISNIITLVSSLNALLFIVSFLHL